MKQAEHKDFGRPEEVREFPKGRLELIKIGGATVGRAVFEPGWKWSSSVQPIAKTKSCEAPHFQYHVAGVLRIRMDDGTEFDCHAGDVSLLPSGHDAWVIGNEPAVVVDFQGMVDYAHAHPGDRKANALDGRNFTGVVLERGKTEGDADTILFKDGRFRSTACDRYQYGDGPYTASVAGDSVSFEAQTQSPKYGELLWRGVVRGTRLDGTLTMVRDGKTLGEKWVLAGEKA